MKDTNPLKDKIKALKVNGTPAFVVTENERLNAHNYAHVHGYRVKTQKSITGKIGFNVYRVS